MNATFIEAAKTIAIGIAVPLAVIYAIVWVNPHRFQPTPEQCAHILFGE